MSENVSLRRVPSDTMRRVREYAFKNRRDPRDECIFLVEEALDARDRLRTAESELVDITPAANREVA